MIILHAVRLAKNCSAIINQPVVNEQ